MTKKKDNKPAGSGLVKNLDKMTRPEIVEYREDLKKKISKLKPGSREFHRIRKILNNITIVLDQRAMRP